MPNNPKMLSGGDVKPTKFYQNLGQAEYFTDFYEVEDEKVDEKPGKVKSLDFNYPAFTIKDIGLALLIGIAVGILVGAFWL